MKLKEKPNYSENRDLLISHRLRPPKLNALKYGLTHRVNTGLQLINLCIIIGALQLAKQLISFVNREMVTSNAVGDIPFRIFFSHSLPLTSQHRAHS